MAIVLICLLSAVAFVWVPLKVRNAKPRSLENALKGQREMEEMSKKAGLVHYGNGTWGPPIRDTETNGQPPAQSASVTNRK
jgi:hypothetical protein